MDEDRELEGEAIIITMGSYNPACRICLKEDLPDSTSFSLHDDKNANKILELESVLFLRTSLADFNFYPTHICYQCMNLLENFLTLKKLCLANEKFLIEHQEDIKEHGISFIKNSNMILNVKEEMDKENLADVEEIDLSDFTIKDSNDFEEDVINDHKESETISASDHGSSKSTKKWKHSAPKTLNTEEFKSPVFNAEEIKKGKQYSCPKCSYVTPQKYSIERHIKRVHRQNRPYSCQFCGKSFVDNIALGKHMKRLHDIHKETCKICYKRFRSDQLAEHTNSCAEDPKMKYNILLRKKNSMSTEDLKREKRKLFLEAMGLGPLAKNGALRIHNVLTEPIPIAETTKDSLLRHKLEMSVKIPCEVCGALTRRDWMKRHLRNLHGIGDKKTQTHVYPKLQCPRCPKKISTLGLAKHMKKVHSLRGALDMPVSCHMCGEEIQCTHMDYHVRNICLMRKAEKVEKDSIVAQMKEEEST